MKGQQSDPLFVMKGAMGYMSGAYTPTAPKDKLHEEIGDIIFDTCYTPDTGSYETGIIDPRYDDSWIIVEEYDTQAQASKGHKKWVKKLTTGNPPKFLPSVQTDSYPLKESQ